MKGAFLLLLISGSLFAARTQLVKKMKDPVLDDLRGFAISHIAPRGAFGNCGFVRPYQISERKYNEYTFSILAAMLVEGQAVKPTLKEIPAKNENFPTVLKHLHQYSSLEVEDDVIEHFEEHMIPALNEGKNRYLYVGTYTDRFDSLITFAAIWDKNSEQILVFGNGRCDNRDFR